MPYFDQRGVILSGGSTFKFNAIEANACGVRLGERVSFIPRTIGATSIATDLLIKTSVAQVNAA